jgi:hypothetical protein
VADGTEDVRKRLSAIKYAEISDEEKEKRYAHYMAEPTEGARWLGFLEALVAGSSTAFAASSPEVCGAHAASRSPHRSPRLI